jgi:hypothetical protein
MRAWPIAILGAALCTATAEAAPIGNAASVLRGADDAGVIEKVAYRCWRRQGVRYCRRYRSGYYGTYSFRQSSGSIGIILGIQ